MLEFAAGLLANITIPEELGTNPKSLLLLLPLVAAIAIIYKATKIPTMSAWIFIKETVVLFISVVVVMAITAVVLLSIAWFVTQ
jgi:hypothetical protein